MRTPRGYYIRRRRLRLQGGEAALQAVVHRFGPQLATVAPRVLELINSGLTTPVEGVLDAQGAMASLQALRVAGPVMPAEMEPDMLRWLHLVVQHCLRHPRSIVRNLGAKCAAALATSRPDTLIPDILR
jgi:hypothetical protein